MEKINRKRIYSFIIDNCVSSFIGFFILSAFNIVKVINLGNVLIFGLKINYGFSFQLFFLLLYFIFFDIFNRGKTIGKTLYNINVVKKVNSETPTRNKLLIRTFYKIMSIIVLPISILLFFSKKGFIIQDKFSKTIVI